MARHGGRQPDGPEPEDDRPSDPRRLTTPYLYFRVRPERVQSWREANEREGRELMADGKWLVAD